MLKPAFQLALGQQLAMTPQLQQAIRLLQLSAQELELEIHTALESNIMLEAEGDPAWSDASSDETAALDNDESEPAFDQRDDERHVAEYMTAGRRRGAPSDAGERELEAIEDAPLRDHLLWQLEMGSLGPADLAIGVALIDALNEDGYLTENLEAVRRSLEPDLSIEIDEVEAMLHYVQMFDPIGTGARNLPECLRLQLRQFDPATPGLDVAARLVEDHLEDLARGDLGGIGRQLKVNALEVEQAAALIRTLNPRPGGALSAAPDEYIVPDVVVSRSDGRWKVELNPVVAPRLRVNGYYASLLRATPGLDGNEMLRANLREARWLIRSLDMRQQTLRKVAAALVERQREFLEHGDEYMRPLILKDIAAEIEVHESTVSRVAANKFMQTPRGVIAFKYFFSNQLPADSGSQRSATAIRALIKKLIANEDAARPLSDGQIVERLRDEDIHVARRTIAKYREAMGIPAKSVRRREGYAVSSRSGTRLSAGAQARGALTEQAGSEGVVHA